VPIRFWNKPAFMSWFYRNLIRPLLFTQDAEVIHNHTMRALAWSSRRDWVRDLLEWCYGAPQLPIEVARLNFPNPVGLAAGMDKSAEALPAWAALGFGFTELGAVTWHPQPGNPLPRVFRAIPTSAIINRMGFNNPGAETVAETLSRWRRLGHWPAHPVGMNIGKSKITPLEQAPEDYAKSVRVLLPHLDFFVINVSSPNTPNLRKLQDKTALDGILQAVLSVRSSAKSAPAATGAESATAETLAGSKPIFIKVAPDLALEALDEILELAERRQVDGIVATNTTITRPQTDCAEIQKIYAETGGLSGLPLKASSTEMIRHIFRRTEGKIPIIGVGGIFNAADAWQKITAGASLIQVYTGMVYEGPGISRGINTGLLQYLQRAGMRDLRQAVGATSALDAARARS
jgi:dihydroorotate dehydrogenase